MRTLEKDKAVSEPALRGRDRGTGPPARWRTGTGTAWRRARFLLIWIPVIILLIWTFLPILMTLSISLKERGQVFVDTGLIPQDFSFRGYEATLASEGFRRAFLNSVLLGFTTLALTLGLCVPAAYAFAKLRFRGRGLTLILVLLPLLVPKVGLMLPLYKMASAIGMIDSYVTLTVVFTGTLLPLATWLMVGFFRAVPRDLEEAAAVDGASFFQRMRRIMLPLALPASITVGILSFREAWTEFDLVLALTTGPEKRTLPYELFLTSEQAGLPNYPAEAAFAILTVVPFILVYSRLERYVTQGFLSGSMK